MTEEIYQEAKRIRRTIASLEYLLCDLDARYTLPIPDLDEISRRHKEQARSWIESKIEVERVLFARL